MRRLRELYQDILMALGLRTIHVVSGGFVLMVLILIYLGFQMDAEDRPPACASGGSIGRCYHITQRICEFTLANAESECRDFVKSMKLPLGRPQGATIFQCQLAHLDKSFLYSRRSIPECGDIFISLDSWKKSNGF